MVVGVIGLDCIGKKICDTSHRPDDVAGFLGKCTDEPVTWMDVWKIIRSEAGLQKGVDGRRFLAYLNKADTWRILVWRRSLWHKVRRLGSW